MPVASGDVVHSVRCHWNFCTRAQWDVWHGLSLLSSSLAFFLGKETNCLFLGEFFFYEVAAHTEGILCRRKAEEQRAGCFYPVAVLLLTLHSILVSYGSINI